LFKNNLLEIFYIILLTIFGGLIVVTLTQYGVRGGVIKDELSRLQEKKALQARLKSNNEAFDTLTLDLEILQEEKNSLEAQETCMGNLDQLNTVTVEKEKK
jgi:hypothetical protein